MGRREAVVFSLIERVTDNSITMRIPDKTSEVIQAATQTLHAVVGDHLGDLFKTITADNGSEFEAFSQSEKWWAKIYFAHRIPRGNGLERHDVLLREIISKGVSIERFTTAQILTFSDKRNERPRKRLGKNIKFTSV